MNPSVTNSNRRVRTRTHGGVAGCVKKTRKRHAVRKMKVGPSEPLCRGRLQTAVSCFSQKLQVVNVTVKRRDTRSRHVGIRETNANEPPTTHRNTTRTTSEPELPARAGRSTEATYLLAVRCPVYRGRDSSLGFRTELENLVCDGKGKGTSGSPVRPKVPTRKPGANCFVVARKRSNSRGAKGAGHPR
jgi:hypothetical protein